jgi:anti-sigma B factor antagonist
MTGYGLTVERLPSGAVCLALRGELDLAHAYSFDEELRRVEETSPPCIVLDLHELTFMDSCGLGRVVAARRRARLILVRGGRAVQRLLAMTRVDEEFEIVGDVPLGLRQPAAAGVL